MKRFCHINCVHKALFYEHSSACGDMERDTFMTLQVGVGVGTHFSEKKI